MFHFFFFSSAAEQKMIENWKGFTSCKLMNNFIHYHSQGIDQGCSPHADGNLPFVICTYYLLSDLVPSFQYAKVVFAVDFLSWLAVVSFKKKEKKPAGGWAGGFLYTL